MKKIFIFVSALILLAFFAWYRGNRDVELNEDNQPSNSQIQMSEKHPDKKRIDSSLKTEESNDPGSSNNLLNEITDTSIPVIKRTVKILELRKMKLSRIDENAMLNHLAEVDPKESASIRNDLIEHSVRYIKDKKLVGDTLVSILENSNHDRVTREYVLQYIPEFYLSRWKPESDWEDFEENDRQKLNQVLWNMTDLTEGSMAGGALFAMYRIASYYPDIELQKVFEKSSEVLTDPGYMNPSRMGAVQILAFSENEEYFQLAKKIVYEEKQPTLLRVTAMNTASQSKFPDREFLDKLKELSQSKNYVHPSLKKCAELTLSKLKY